MFTVHLVADLQGCTELRPRDHIHLLKYVRDEIRQHQCQEAKESFDTST